MGSQITGRRRPTKVKKHANVQKRKREDVDVHSLQKAVDALDMTTTYTKFSDLPLSEPTKAGLRASHFSDLTDIQQKAIPLALKGSDILGAARTGSGKTLAFLIPVLENLYRDQCVGPDAGLGAMIVSPTRELASQIFEVLKSVGRHGHLFAAGCIIGGKSLQEEQQALARMNIVVCTPGRMLQHLSQTAAFSVDNLKMLVLDEADRILDMGFQRDVDAIVEYLPKERQTLLFSATQTKKVSDLARLSLNNPEYVAVHEASATATPKNLQQNYILTPLPQKLDTLWSFIQSSKKSKILVFMSSGKQVRFVYESFRQLQPGIPLLHLHGRQRQSARLDITSRFAAAQHSCLFATDVVARGLDFPAVDWVVQLDCPEDADTYIHRVGRTARYERDGRAVLFLDPSEEEGMLERLAAKKVPIERINVRQKKQQSISGKLQGLCFKNPELKYLGQKAFASYVRSVHLQKDKDIYKIEEYKLEDFATSLGLPGAPRIRFVKADVEAAKKAKNAPRRGMSPMSEEDESDEDAEEGAEKQKPTEIEATGKQQPGVRTKYDRMFQRQNQDILASHYQRMIEDGDTEGAAQLAKEAQDDFSGAALPTAADGDDDLFTVRRRIPASPDPDESAAEENDTSKPFQKQSQHDPLIIDSNRRARALKSKKKVAKLIGTSSQKLVFDDSGVAHEAHPFEDEKVIGDKDAARRKFLEEEAERVRAADVRDRAVAREKRQVKKDRRRERERAEVEGESVGVANRRERRKRGRGGDDEEDDGDEEGGLERVERPFEDLADLYEDEDVHEEAERPNKKQKKWFQNDKVAGRGHEGMAEAETLEDLEKLAAGVLG